MSSASWWWNQASLDRAVRSWGHRVLKSACQYLEFQTESLIAIQGAPVLRRSRPGEPPRRETGDLIRSWTYAVSTVALEAWVHSDLDYSYYLEVGAAATFGIILPRPYVRRALLSSLNSLSIILTQPMP